MAKRKKIIIKIKRKKAPTPAVVAEVAKVIKENKGELKANTIPKAKVAVKATKNSKQIDWSVVKVAYVTDPKATTRGIAKQFGLARSTIQKRSARDKWADERREYVKKTESNSMETASEDREAQIIELTKKHGTLLDSLSLKITLATDKLHMDEWAAKNLESLAKASKLVIEGERLTIGLPSDVKGLSDPRGDRLTVTIESLHEKAKQVLNGNDNS